MISKSLLTIFRFINQCILRRSKESTLNAVTTYSVLKANVLHGIRYKLGMPLKLKNPNPTVTFPLPSHWTSEKQYSRQSTSLVVKQLQVTSRAAGNAENDLINRQQNRGLSNIYYMRLTSSAHHLDIDQLQHIINGQESSLISTYSKTWEELLGESLVNGEHSYVLRTYNSTAFDLERSAAIDKAYKQSLLDSINNEQYNEQNLKASGFTKDQIQELVRTGKDLYYMFFEDLEDITKGNTLEHQPTILMDNTQIKEKFYFQTPYPILTKNANGRFVCIAIGFRYKINEGGKQVQKVQFYSPFFQKQPYKVWRLAQSQLGQTIFTDFNIRFHLGLLHFSTNQYLVPISNFLHSLKTPTTRNNYQNFIHYTINIFSKGLDGVNVIATASLVHPVEKYAIINRVFNINQTNALNLMAAYSNRIDFTKLSPKELLIKNGISTELASKELIRATLDLQFYDIISNYIDKVYDIFEMDKMSKELMLLINKEIPRMSVADGKHRPFLNSPQDVKTLIKNLAFCWCGYHAHTFAGISYYTYYNFRPTMLRKAVPYHSSEWEGLQPGEQLPPTKVMMETGKLTQGTTQVEAENFILDIMRQQQFRLEKQVLFRVAEDLRQQEELKEITTKTVERLIVYRDRVDQVNASRKDVLFFNYLSPEYRQASLNI